jgi:hypothetical protein
MPHTIEKLLMRVTTLIGGPHTKLWASKIVGVRKVEVLGQKRHLSVGLVVMHRVYYKGEGGGFPQVWAVLSLMSLCSLVVRLCTKSVSAMH